MLDPFMVLLDTVGQVMIRENMLSSPLHTESNASLTLDKGGSSMSLSITTILKPSSGQSATGTAVLGNNGSPTKADHCTQRRSTSTWRS